MTTLLLFALQTVTLGATNYTVDVTIAAPASAPSFADEFDGASVDQAKWRYDTSRNLAGWHNNERQYYADARPENARIEDGRKPLGYGFYEIRAKLPCGRGAWPAIWMLPSSGKWPDAGEIDIMEMVGFDPGVIHATLHTGAFNHAKGTQRGAQRRVATACGAFHRYQLDWRADKIIIGIDDRAHMRVANDQPGGAAAWPFTRPYDLILNVAVGGDWGGKRGSTTRRSRKP